jgi:hypothetical protein
MMVTGAFGKPACSMSQQKQNQPPQQQPSISPMGSGYKGTYISTLLKYSLPQTLFPVIEFKNINLGYIDSNNDSHILMCFFLLSYDQFVFIAL